MVLRRDGSDGVEGVNVKQDTLLRHSLWVSRRNETNGDMNQVSIFSGYGFLETFP
jgi:hypothetical protein